MKPISANSVRIIPFREDLKDMLKTINYEWIEQYFHVTELDRRVLENPKREILDKGGYIYFAQYQDKIVGSVALERITDTQYALTRMGVRPSCQGMNIGQLLIDKAIEKAKELALENIMLYTNQILINALNLYFKNGFKAVPMDTVPYKRATIKMQLNFAAR